jgi:uncharacterized membrane protein YidH (DUF202 family)
VTHPADVELQDQHERTLLAWRRTALSLVATGLLVAHLAGRTQGPATLIITLSGTASVVAFVWLGRARLVGATGLALVLAVLLLAIVSLSGILMG